jgi:outer membrane protein OmpA-like peptidoglycan-associated protein
MKRSITLQTAAFTGIALLAASAGVGAGQAGYAASSDDRIVTTGFGNCVQTDSWNSALSLPECDPALAARLEAERLAAEAEARRAAELAAMQARVDQPTLIRLSDKDKVAFAFNSATLTAQSERELSQVLDVLSRYDRLEAVQITGHTDNTGPEDYNHALSERRAQSVKDFLVARGVDSGRISVSGVGEMQPVADNHTREGRAQNRRVDIRISGDGYRR